MNAAAIRGCFSDFRTVKGRKVAQLIVEVPIEEATAALNALGGVPNPEHSIWVAIARLNENATSEPEKPRKAWADLPPSQQAAIRCGEPDFWRFLLTAPGVGRTHIDDAEMAAKAVRFLCGCRNSRKELDEDHRKRVCWHALDASYLQSTGRLAHG